jgi:GT2 family glycosyltransferase
MRRLCDSIRTNTRRAGQLEIMLVVDSDDDVACRFEYPELDVRVLVGAPGRTMGELNMAGYRAARGQYLMLLNDDVVISTPNWDDQVLDVFRTYPDGMVLVHVNDKIFGDNLCTFPFLTRTFCELAGGISNEGYLRYRIDDHIQGVFDLIAELGYRRRIFLADVVFEHLNLTPVAEGHSYVVNPEIHAVDSRRFEALMPERKRLALEAIELIERRARPEVRRVREARLELVQSSEALRDHAHLSFYSGQAPKGKSRVTVGVVSADLRSDHARRCIDQIKAHTADYDLVIIDNNYGPGFNHSREMNRLLDLCRTDYLVLMDDDVFVEAGWVEGLLRAVEPGVGVVSPVHKAQNGKFSYGGVVLQPDDSGHHTHVMNIGDRPQHIQTLCSALMLIDMQRCGHIRLNEVYSKYFLDIDYGLRVWEEGWRVLCSPWTAVTHIGGGTLAQGSEECLRLFEEQRRRWQRSWVDTNRIHALRRGIWRDIPEFVEISMLEREIDRLFLEGTRLSRDIFYGRACSLVDNLHHLPALKNYLAVRAYAALSGRTPRADEPQHGFLAVLLGLTRHPVLFESGSHGMDVALWDRRFYAFPADEGPFSPERKYSRSFEAADVREIREWIANCSAIEVAPPADPAVPIPDPLPPGEPVDDQPVESPAVSLEPLAPGIGSALKRLGRSLPYWNCLRPRILVRRGANLFDPSYYLATYPDVSDHGGNPLLHFLLTGAFEGRSPHSLFDSSFYLGMYPDVVEAKVNPLGHYLRYGAREGRQPHPLFDSVYYLKRYPDVRKSGLNPLVHYVLYGAEEGRQPHPWFEPEYYLDHCSGSWRGIRNPLLHFLQSNGQHRGNPHPEFDCEYYLRQNPGVAAAGMNPLVHYVCFGARAGRWPRAAFRTL